MARNPAFLPLARRPLLRRLMLAEVLGPPRAMQPHTTPLARRRQGAHPQGPAPAAASAPTNTEAETSAPSTDRTGEE